MNLSLSGQTTVKRPVDSQTFTVLPTTGSISQLTTNVTLVQGSQTAILSFVAIYPDGSQAKTGTATIRVVEPDGVSIHSVDESYNTTLNTFEGAYRIGPTCPQGAWAVVIDPNSFDDGFANVGPAASVVRGFVVAPASSQSSQGTLLTYMLLVVIILLAAVLAIILSWVLFSGRKKIQRNVLKVDFQSIEREAARVENRDFFGKIHDQLKRQQSKPEENPDG